MKKIAFITDSHIGQKAIVKHILDGSSKMYYENAPNEHKENLTIILDDVIKTGIHEIVFGGDIGTLESYPWFAEIFKRHSGQLSLIAGNHDRFADLSRFWDTSLTKGTNELFYEREDEYCKYLFLDTSSNVIGEKQFSWIKEELKSDKHIIIFIHHPVLSIATPVDGIGAALQGRDELKRILLDHKNDITIFCGHYHLCDEAKDHNIHQFTTISASYQFQKKAAVLDIDTSLFGYGIITITNNRVTLETKIFQSL